MFIIDLFIHAFTFVLLICCWLVADIGVRGKIILTLVDLGTWGLMLLSYYLGLFAEFVLCVVLWAVTFGPGSFGGRRR